MRELGRLPQPRHQRLVGDADELLAICRVVYADGGQERYAYTFGRCSEPEWTADSPTDRRVNGWLANHGLGPWVPGPDQGAFPLIVAVGDTDGSAALTLENELTKMRRWLRGNDTARLTALARFADTRGRE